MSREVVVETEGRWTVAWDGWLGLDEDERPADRFQHRVCHIEFDTRAEAEAWLLGYDSGARENM